MIRKVVVRRFKRFDDVTFEFPRHVVLAGPNNTGKTTVLQAIAAWDLAFDRWRRLNDFQRHGGAYTKAPLTRQQFSAVPLRSFDLLWRNRDYHGSVVIEIQSEAGWTVPMEFIANSTEQVYARPLHTVDPATLRRTELTTVFVPPMTGLGIEEPLYARQEFLDAMLAQARPGEVLRNLLHRASESEEAWSALCDSIAKLFDYELLPPDAGGAYILAEYRARRGGPRFDVASAGSGFQQVLMLLTFLNTRPGAVLLLDEPDAHLHIILQDAIFDELRSAAFASGSQLVIATHSEVIINGVDPRNLCVMLHTPRLLATTEERRLLIRSLGILTNSDIMLAEDAPGILYVESYNDLAILRAWARVLGHPSEELLTTRLFWRPVVHETRRGAAGIRSEDHYNSLRLVNSELPGLEILDRDARTDVPETEVTGSGLQRRRWGRYEIESYLVHPTTLERFVEHVVGQGAASADQRRAMRSYIESEFRSGFLETPLNPEPLVENYLQTKKARTEILPRILDAAGLPAFPSDRYHEIAAVMTAEEIHPDVVRMLDAICEAFSRP